MNSKTFIASTSGVRGVIGHELTPELAARYGGAYGTFVKKGTVILGRDSRPSGDMIMRAVSAGLVSVGIDVVEIGIVPTPTVEIAVKDLKAAGGICITASHNPSEWNALKFFNNTGEFLSPDQYRAFDAILKSGTFTTKPYSGLGKISTQDVWVAKHVKQTLALKVINKAAIKKAKFKIVLDCINGAGSTALPMLLEALGVKVIKINCEGDGNFVHEPEPIPKNMKQLCDMVVKKKADFGMASDPDADRLALVDEHGKPIGEELTLAIAVKEVLKKIKGATVINLSTSKATADIADAAGSKVFYSKVGEANVVDLMHKKNAVIGGEGNGGVIFPSFHTGRDSLVAAALTLSCVASEKRTLGELAKSLPKYYAVKTKAALPDDFPARLQRFEAEANRLFGSVSIDKQDGIRCDFSGGWAQIRSSNTEPIYRLIVETNHAETTDRLTKEIQNFFAA